MEYIEKEHTIPDTGLYSRGNHIDYGNVLYKNWSLFIPKEYTIVESVILHDSNVNEVKNRSFLIADYYLARFDSIAEGLIGDILHREADKNPLSLITVQREDEFYLVAEEIKEKLPDMEVQFFEISFCAGVMIIRKEI